MRKARNFGEWPALLLLACLLLSACGRFGVHLMPRDASMDASRPDADSAIDTDAGDSGLAADGGCDGSSCEPVMCAARSTTQNLCGCGVDATGDSDSDGVPDCSDFCPARRSSATTARARAAQPMATSMAT